MTNAFIDPSMFSSKSCQTLVNDLKDMTYKHYDDDLIALIVYLSQKQYIYCPFWAHEKAFIEISWTLTDNPIIASMHLKIRKSIPL